MVLEGIYPQQNYTALAEALRDAERTGESVNVQKALTTGNGIVANLATGGQALREQFLVDGLRDVLYEDEDARFTKSLGIEKAYSVTVEWTTFDRPGDGGDGFQEETGDASTYNFSGADDSYTRRTKNIKYLGVQRQVGVVARNVDKTLVDPFTQSEKAAMLDLTSKIEKANLYSDETLNGKGWTGVPGQIWDWLRGTGAADEHPEDATVIFDARGAILEEQLISEIQTSVELRFGSLQELWQTPQGYSDTDAALFSRQRGDFGSKGVAGGDRAEFISRFGRVKRDFSKFLRANKPLDLGGIASTGKPRAATETGAIAWSATPFSAIAAQAPSTGYWWNYTTRSNGDNRCVTTAPSLPNGSDSGSPTNHLAAGDHYYALSLVVNGRESAYWANGAAAAGTLTAAAAVTATLGQIIKITVAVASATFGANSYRNVRFRVYRYSTTGGGAAPTSLSQFNLVEEGGFPAGATNGVFFDNGLFIPGAETAFGLTKTRQGKKCVSYLEMLAPLRRDLPATALSDQFCVLTFGTPILWTPRHHVQIINIGRA